MFTGKMRDVYVWDVALTTSELDALRLASDPTSGANPEGTKSAISSVLDSLAQ